MRRGRKRLGKGLGALLPSAAPGDQGIRQVPLDSIRPNPHQPRTEFDEEALDELAASISVHGVVQPVLLVEDGDGYVLVAGERRWRAAARAGLATIPALVRELDPLEMTEVALIENLQREDLSPMEEAHAYRTLQEEFDLTQDEIGRRVGKSRSQVANTLRLLNLDARVQEMLMAGEISMGHAKVILGVADPRTQRRLADQAAAGTTVRALEGQLKALTAPAGSTRKKRQPPEPADDPHLAQLSRDLQRALGTRVALEPIGSSGKGRIIIEYYSSDDLSRIYDQLAGNA